MSWISQGTRREPVSLMNASRSDHPIGSIEKPDRRRALSRQNAFQI
jgi:hypothetical protein